MRVPHAVNQITQLLKLIVITFDRQKILECVVAFELE